MIELRPAESSVFMPATPVDPDTAEALDVIADLEGMTPSLLVRRALRDWTFRYLQQHDE